MDPKLSKLLENCPDLQNMLHDPEFMRQATEALRNPVHVRDVLRSTDRSMTHLEEKLLGGGFDVLRSLVEDINRPKQDEAYMREQEKLKELAKMKTEKKKKPAGEEGEDGEDDEDANPTEEDLGRKAPEWAGTFDTNAMASMMQDQNMQQLLSQMVQSLGGPAHKPHPDDPFIDPGFLGQMFHSQTIQSVSFLQESIGKLSLAPDQSEEKTGKAKKAAKAAPKKGGKKDAGGDDKDEKAKEAPEAAQDSPAVLSGLNIASPAANPKEAFQLFLQAELESPEIRYKGQLSAMANMGFTDKEACIQALHAHDGNMNKAVESLMQAQKS